MSTVQALVAFVAAATVLTITPGVDTAMVLRSASIGSRPAAFAAIGICLGCLVWGALVSVGLGALLAASPTVFTALKWAGAAYLLWLGVKQIRSPRQSFETDGGNAPRTSARSALRRGFLTNLLNPKVGVFYVTFLPQFVPAGADVATFSFVLAAIHVLLSLVWFAALIAATVPLGRALRRPAVIKWLDRITGGVFVAFAARLALAK